MRDKIISIGFFGFILTFSLMSFFFPDHKLSFVERRKLVVAGDLQNDFFNKVEDYVVDQIPFRNELLMINSIWERKVLGNQEKNDVYVIDNTIYEKNYPLSENSVQGFVDKMNIIKNHYFPNKNIYYTIIPDKSYYLSDNYLKLDYDKLLKDCQKINGKYINIWDDFNINDYYQTDIHLKQESFLKILPKLSNELGFTYEKIDYQEKVFYPFYGASYGKAMKLVKPDKLGYLVNSLPSNVVVKHLEYGFSKLYNETKLTGMDSYDVFLDGASALIEIWNNNSNSGRNLIIFRDSFASSLTPLLVPYYDKITLIDLRYINLNLLDQYLTLNNNEDVLFMYSTMIINNSSILKVNN